MDLPSTEGAPQESYYATPPPPDGTSTSLAYKLDIPYTNNEAEYEALVIGLTSALKVRVRRLQI